MPSTVPSAPPDRVPVIIGIGEIADRPDSPEQGLEPAKLMAAALRRADADAGGGWLRRLDALDIVNSVSWPYGDLPGRLAELIDRRPAHLVHGPVGGETPIRFLHEAALRIAAGTSQVAAICGGEAEHSASAARRAGISLPWTAPDPNWVNPRRRDYLHPLALKHGLSQPIFVYPIYEAACQAAWGQTPRQGRAESAALWSAFSEVAAANPSAWLRRPYAAEEIATFSAANRPIAWPYPKLMVANPTVNQGGALLLASLALARTAGIPERRLVYPWVGAAAQEPLDWVSRDAFNRSPAQDAVLDAVMRKAGLDASTLDAVELYSCFPCVPKMARRTLGLAPGIVPTVAGGLTFFGAPLNSYMTHAAAAMVRHLRDRPGSTGLLYGQGGFVTKHHALVLASRPSAGEADPALSVQEDADRRRGPVPAIVEDARSRAAIESYTILFDRAGEPQKGVVVLRTREGSRTLARVQATDRESIAALMDLDRPAIGLDGTVRPGDDGLLDWSAG